MDWGVPPHTGLERREKQMARKIECDRCGKQWSPIVDEDDYEQNELSTVSFSVPWRPDLPPIKSPSRAWISQPQISEQMDMCQACARATHKFATTKPEEYGDIS
jgi:hypothetical protein